MSPAQMLHIESVDVTNSKMTVVIDGLPNKVRRHIGSKERTATYWFAENAGGNQLHQFSGESTERRFGKATSSEKSGFHPLK